MSEMVKTIVFIAAAAGSLLVAFVAAPGSKGIDVEEFIGLRLNEFEVEDAKRLKIVKFDRETASTHEFEIAEVEGLWTIPSKQGYPADANRRMAEAVNNVIDREILRIAARSASEHKTLGVLNPESSKLNSKSAGAGTRIVISDAADNVLSDMIIGKPVPESEDQYHVRDTDKDLVYVVNLNPENLSTSFKDWIEGDLLQLNPLDLQEVAIHDYSAEIRPVLTAGGIGKQVLWDRRGEFSLVYDKGESTWNAKGLQQFDVEKTKLVPFELAEDEELNKEALQEMRDSLEDLLIVDVVRKPAGLSADLQAGEGFLNNRDAIDDLGRKGFAAVPLEQGAEPEILSSEGQLVCAMSDGVEYVLRFGNLKADSQETGAADSPAETEEGGAEPADSGNDIYRYLFVMARFNGLLLASPELEGFPPLPEGITEEDLKAATEAAAASVETAGTEEPEESEPDDTARSDGSSPEEPKVEEEEEEEESDAVVASEETANEGGEATVEETVEETEEATEKNATEEKEEQIGRILVTREGIRQENERRQDEYQEKLTASKKQVKELNERFGNWYYVIDNEVYKKIHLSKDQLIKKKEKEEEASDPANSNPAASGLPGLPNLPASGS